MRLKVIKSWFQDGDVRLELIDKEAPMIFGSGRMFYNGEDRNPSGLRRQIIQTLVLPRATPKAEVKDCMRAMKHAHEIRCNAVSD